MPSLDLKIAGLSPVPAVKLVHGVHARSV